MKTTVVKGSREDLLEQVYQRLEATYEYEGKEAQLNSLQEMMVVFSTLSKKKAIMIIAEQNQFDFKTWYENNE